MWMLYSAVYLDAFLKDDQREIFANDISLSSFGCCSPKKKTNFVTQTRFYRSQEEMSVASWLCVGWRDESESPVFVHLQQIIQLLHLTLFHRVEMSCYQPSATSIFH